MPVGRYATAMRWGVKLLGRADLATTLRQLPRQPVQGLLLGYSLAAVADAAGQAGGKRRSLIIFRRIRRETGRSYQANQPAELQLRQQQRPGLEGLHSN